MSAPNFAEFYKATWYENPVQRQNIMFQVAQNKFLLNEIPDEFRGVYIENMYEIGIEQEISNSQHFKVNYATGEVFVHETLSSQWVKVVSFYAKGRIDFYANHIIVQDPNNYWVSDNLEDVLAEFKYQIDTLQASDTDHVPNVSSVISGGTCSDALEHLDTNKVEITALKSDNVINNSTITGSNVTQALNNINAFIMSLPPFNSDFITNGSTVSGVTVSDALEFIDARIDNLVISSGDPNIELADARTNSYTAITYPVLSARLDEEYNKHVRDLLNFKKIIMYGGI